MNRPCRVLLFDDDEEYLSLVEKGAVGNPDQPIQWITASTEDEAKSKLVETKGNIDLILIDYLLPIRSGVEFLNSLRQEGHAVPSMLISHLDERSLLSDLAERFKKVEVFSLYIIGYLQKPNNLIDNYPRFVEDIIEHEQRNRRMLFETSMQFMKNADSFLSDLKLDVATISRALSMLVVHFRAKKNMSRRSLGSLISAIEQIEANLWEVANRLSDAWKTLRDMAISGLKVVRSESSTFRPPEVALKLAWEDKRRIRDLLMGTGSRAGNRTLLSHINHSLESKKSRSEKVEMLRDVVIGIAQIDDDFQTGVSAKAQDSKLKDHQKLLEEVEGLLLEEGEDELSLIVKIIRIKHLKRYGSTKDFAFSLDSAFKSSLDLPDNYLKREVFSTLQGLIDEPRQ